MAKTLFLYLLLVPFILLGQKDTEYKSEETSTSKKGSSYITFGVSPTLFLVSPRWNFGYIQNVDEKIKLGINFGIGAENFVVNTYNTRFSDYFIWEVRPEIYIMHNPEKKVNIYNSIELFYINESAVIKDSYYINENDYYIYYSQADYNRQKYGVIANFGVFIPFSSSFGMNVYAGLGIKWRLNTYTNVDQTGSSSDYEDFLWIHYYRKEGLLVGFQPNFGAKLNLIIQ